MLTKKLYMQYGDLGLKIIGFFQERGVFIYSLVPLSGKVPIKDFPLGKIYEGEEVGIEIFSLPEEPTGFGIPTGIHNLVVVDFDDRDLFMKFRNMHPSLLDTLIVKTRRGFHVYYKISDRELKNEPGRRFSGIDVKTGRSYVVAPFSVVDYEFEYSVENDASVMEISYEGYLGLLKILAELVKKEEERIVERNSDEGLVDKIVDLILPSYREGVRQDICLGLSGYLLKKHVRVEVIRKIIETLHKKGNDTDSLQQRLSALQCSLKKPLEGLIGAKKLIEIVGEDAVKELNRLFEDEKIESEDGLTFIADEREKYWYAFDGKKKIKVCDLFSILKAYADPDLSFVAYNHASGGIKELSSSTEEWRRFLLIYSPSKFEHLLGTLTRKVGFIKRKKELGWNKDRSFFNHPAIDVEAEYVLYPFDEEDFLPPEHVKRLHHDLIRALLKEGKILGAKYVLALASLFSSFTVIDIAPRGSGKTTTSHLATQLFCRYKEPLTLLGTETGIELLFSKLKNFPILLDEGALGTDEKAQKTVFMLKGKKGKIRGTKNLSVHVRDVEGVAFLTNERDFSFNRFGAERRVIKIIVNKREEYTDYPFESLVRCLGLYGAGIDFIDFYLKNRELIDDTEDIFKAKGMEDISSAVSKAFILLKNYYSEGENFQNLEQTLRTLIKNQEKEATKDTFELFIEALKQFVVMNINNFETNSRKEVKNQLYGRIVEGEKVKVYILTEVLRNFCEQNNFSLQTVLAKAKEKGMLETKETNRFVVKQRVGGLGLGVYCFVFDDLNEEEIKNEEEEAEEDFFSSF